MIKADTRLWVTDHASTCRERSHESLQFGSCDRNRDTLMANASERRRILSDCVKFGVTLALLGLLLTRVDLRATGAQIAAIGLQTSVICTLAIIVLSVLVALRWKLILRRMNAPLQLAESWRLVMIGSFFSIRLCHPASVAIAVRVWLVGRAGYRLRVGFISVAADRMFALFGGPDLHGGDASDASARIGGGAGRGF